MANVNITFNGKEFLLSCDDGQEEHLQELAEQMNKKFSGLKFVSSEQYEKVDLKSITTYKEKDKLLFGGFIDLVYKHKDGYIIIDWKTDRDDGKASVHKRQLAVYKKMYSVLYNIPPEKITTCVIFVALRGSINTGKFGSKIESSFIVLISPFNKLLLPRSSNLLLLNSLF